MYGDRWTELGPARLLDELAEGAADIGSWAVLALQALDDAALERGEQARLSALLLKALSAGALAHRAIQAARAKHLELVR